jgi:hypothetical protein
VRGGDREYEYNEREREREIDLFFMRGKKNLISKC